MWSVFGREFPDALNNTLAIAEKCAVELAADGDNFTLPVFPVPDSGLTRDEYFDSVVATGFEERKEKVWLPLQNAGKLRYSLDDYSARITREFAVIRKMGFQDYFLITWDLLQTCQDNGSLNAGTSCPNGCVTSSPTAAVCAPTCRPGTYRCASGTTPTAGDGAQLQQCNATGTGWTLVQTCGSAALCDEQTDECGDCGSGDYSCSAGPLRSCNASGHWTSTGTANCFGNNLYTCSGNTLTGHGEVLTEQDAFNGCGNEGEPRWTNYDEPVCRSCALDGWAKGYDSLQRGLTDARDRD
jgi:hypothetical protein